METHWAHGNPLNCPLSCAGNLKPRFKKLCFFFFKKENMDKGPIKSPWKLKLS